MNKILYPTEFYSYWPMKPTIPKTLLQQTMSTLTIDYIIKTNSMFLTTTSYNSVFVVFTMILPIQAIQVLAILMNSYIEIITGPTCKGLSRNMFANAIHANAANVPNSRIKMSFDRYRSLTKRGKTLAQISSPAYLQSKVQMLFAILQITFLKNIITLLLIKKLTPKDQRIFLYITVGSFMASPDLLYRIVVPSLSITSGNSCAKNQVLVYGCPLHGTLKQMVKPSDSMELWNNTLELMSTTSKMTGLIGYPQLNSLAAIPSRRPQKYLFFLQIKDFILAWVLNLPNLPLVI